MYYNTYVGMNINIFQIESCDPRQYRATDLFSFLGLIFFGKANLNIFLHKIFQGMKFLMELNKV